MGEDEFRRVWSFFFGDDCDVIEENDLYFSTNIILQHVFNTGAIALLMPSYPIYAKAMNAAH